jgi:thymidylate synthase ThyX
MISIKNYSNGTRLSSIIDNSLGINISVIGSGLKADTIAYIMACISRNKESIIELLDRISSTPTENNEKKVEQIIEGYGHSSVRALGHLPVSIEGLSILHSLQCFNLSALQDGQERSTRYVNILDTQQSNDWFYIPKEIQEIPELKESYISVMQYWMSAFQQSLSLYKINIKDKYEEGNTLTKKVVNSRALDCARYFLPLGTRTVTVMNQNGREWVELISMFESSLLKGDAAIGTLLENLLTQTEGGMLIKHTHKNANQLNKTALDHVKDIGFTEWSDSEDNTTEFMQVFKEGLPLEWGYKSILNPHIETLNSNKPLTLHNTLMAVSNHHKGLDKRVSRITSGMVCHGISDIGTLKDLNRHRGMVYMPLLMEGFVFKNSTEYPPGTNYYSVPPYIEEGRLNHLEEDFCNTYNKGMDMVDDWFYTAEEELGAVLANELIKYLLPHAFNTPYFISGDISRWHYLLNLRKGLDGHISYRKWTYDCNAQWQKKGYNFVPNMVEPDASSITELEYRS